MFKNYDDLSTYRQPDNRRAFGFFDNTDEIIIGATATHVFHLDFDFNEICDELKVVYSQSIGKVLEKSLNSIGLKVDVHDGVTDIYVNLSTDETRMFTAYRKTKAQLKLFLCSGEVIVGGMNKINVYDTLDELKPTEQQEAE